MWKYVSRRVRDTFERSANYFDKRGTTGVVNSSQNFKDEDKTSNSPCQWFSPKKCWGSFSGDENTNSKRWNFEHLNQTWIGAITWSSSLVLGWYAGQLINLKHKYHRKDSKSQRTLCGIISSLQPYAVHANKDALHYNSNVTIEKLLEKFTPTVHLVANEQSGVHDSTKSNINTNPDSSDSELDDVLNSIENKLGLAAIENGQHQEGLNLLRSAANRNHAPAIYNLGLCYELGLGVAADEKVAMGLYKSAATLHHPGALYNLGIYYGQGRGGLGRDTETATRLLKLAAVQGQKDAIQALQALDVDTKTPLRNEGEPWRPLARSQEMAPINTKLFVENVNFITASNGGYAVY